MGISAARDPAGHPAVDGNDIHILDSSFERVATIRVEEKVAAIVAGDAGLYVSTYRSEFGHGVAHHEYHLLRYEYRSIPSLLLPPSNIVPVKARAELHEMMSYLAVGDGAVWCMGETRVYRFDESTLECSFEFEMQFEVGGDPRHGGAMTVHANELYIAFRGDRLQPYTIKVYSFGGQLIRSFPVPSSHTELNDREPLELYSSRDRLYLSESVPMTAGARSQIFVLSADGALLAKIESGDREQFTYMSAFDDKLLLTKNKRLPEGDDVPNVVVALKGL